MTSAAPRIRARDLALVFIGGTLGTAARLAVMFFVGEAALAVVNLTGAFLLGVLTAMLTRTPSAQNRRTHLLLGTGALGGFTTYSALAVSATDPAGLVTAVLIAIGGVITAGFGFLLGGGFRATGATRSGR